MTCAHILVVEDDAALVLLLEDLLTEEGYHTVVCSSGTDALRSMQQTRPDLVILDLWLEERGGGWDILERLRQDATTTELPVIICTGDAQAVAGTDAARCAAHCTVLAKPFDVDTLLTTVQAALTPHLSAHVAGA